MNIATVPDAGRKFGEKSMIRKRIELLIDDPNVFGIIFEIATKDENGKLIYKPYESIMIDDDVDRVILGDVIKVHRRIRNEI